MGTSVDYSNGIAAIREAHEDSVAILEKWRELIESPGEITLQVRRNGTVYPVTLPSIREAINRYLGGVFEKITLTTGSFEVTLQLDTNGRLTITNENSIPADLIVGDLYARSIYPAAGGTLSIPGNVSISGGTIANAEIQNLIMYGGQAYGTEFKGNTTVSGNATITGTATIRNALVERLETSVIKYRKQTLQWGVEAIVDAQLNTTTSNGLWIGSPSVLERAGIFSSPAWSDCIYVPDPFIATAEEVNVYYGATGDTKVAFAAGYRIPPCLAAMWPYKMYEETADGYRIRWLPFDGQEKRMTYLRTGAVTAASGQVAPILYTSLHTAQAGGGLSAGAAGYVTAKPYACLRYIADVDTAPTPDVVENSASTYHRLYATG